MSSACRWTPKGTVLAPIRLNKWLVLFCDEINLPDMDKYGTQKVISFLRQIVEHGGFYRTSDRVRIKLERVQFVGACNPPTDPGRKPLSHRYEFRIIRSKSNLRYTRIITPKRVTSGGFPRLSAWAAQLRRNVPPMTRHWRRCVRFDRRQISMLKRHIESVPDHDMLFSMTFLLCDLLAV